MIRLATILALLSGPLLPLTAARGVDDSSAASSAATQCCCCPTGECQCGCEVPAESGPSDDDSSTPRFCACNDTPMNLPLSGPTTPERFESSGFAYIAVAAVAELEQEREFRGRLPHGPPQTLRMLATFVLLN